MNLADLIGDMRSGSRSRASRRYSGRVQPDGFAPYKRRMRREERAVSPDNVVLRVRAEKHKPRADLTFWEEALVERMKAAGYKLVDDPSPLQIGWQEAFMLEMNAPLGVDDFTYLVVVVPDGRRLIIAEAAGEITRFAARRDAIIAAIQEQLVP